MGVRTRAGLAVLAASVLGVAAGAQPPAAPPAAAGGDPPAPRWVAAQDLRVRPGGQKTFTKDTPRIGVEFFSDEANGATLALSEVGAVAVAKGAPEAKGKAEWLFAHDLRVRKAGEPEFTQTTKRFGVEVFKDGGTGRLLYVTESAGVALTAAPAAVTRDKGPKWHHALEVKVRAPDEDTFDKAKRVGIEVFLDENTGGLVYITEAGLIAAVAKPGDVGSAAVKAPTALYGLELKVRKADEKDFTDATKRVGVEVFRDENTGGLLYVTQAGAVAAVPAPSPMPDARGVTWKQAMNLKARKGGQDKFDQAASYGIEVFQDNRTGYLVYISETGAIAVLPK